MKKLLLHCQSSWLPSPSPSRRVLQSKLPKQAKPGLASTPNSRRAFAACGPSRDPPEERAVSRVSHRSPLALRAPSLLLYQVELEGRSDFCIFNYKTSDSNEAFLLFLSFCLNQSRLEIVQQENKNLCSETPAELADLIASGGQARDCQNLFLAYLDRLTFCQSLPIPDP